MYGRHVLIGRGGQSVYTRAAKLHNGGGVSQCAGTSLNGAEVRHSPREAVATGCRAVLSNKDFPVFFFDMYAISN